MIIETTNNRPFHKTLLGSLFLALLLLSSCAKEDDVQAIFEGKTWYVTGAVINGQSIDGAEITALFASQETYLLRFSSTTFTGILASGSSLAGTWSADGKHQTLSLKIQQADQVNATTLSRNLYNILNSATSYSGDTHILYIKADNKNYIQFDVSKRK